MKIRIVLLLVAALVVFSGCSSMTPAEWEIADGLIDVFIMTAVAAFVAYAVERVCKIYSDLSMLENERWWVIKDAIVLAVKEAERVGLDEKVLREVGGKFELAKKFLQAQLDARGIKLNIEKYADAIATLIEQAVHDNFPHEPEDDDSGWEIAE